MKLSSCQSCAKLFSCTKSWEYTLKAGPQVAEEKAAWLHNCEWSLHLTQSCQSPKWALNYTAPSTPPISYLPEHTPGDWTITRVSSAYGSGRQMIIRTECHLCPVLITANYESFLQLFTLPFYIKLMEYKTLNVITRTVIYWKFIVGPGPVFIPFIH